MSALKKFAGQTAVYGLSTIASRVLNFFLTPVFTKVYPVATYGILTTLFAWASILNAVMAFGMETTFFRYLNKKDQNKENIYSNTFWVIAIICLVFLSISFFTADSLARWMQQGKSASLADYQLYIWLFVFILIADALSVIPFAKIRAEGRPGRYAVIKLLNISVFIGLNLFFLFVLPYLVRNNYWPDALASWYKMEWVGYVFVSNLVASVITFILLIPELSELRFTFDKRLLAEMLVYSSPILIANLSFIINEQSDKIFLEHLLPPSISEEQVGIYGACCKLAIFLSIFINAFRLGAEPFFFNQANKENAKETYATIMSYFVIAITAIFVGLVANIEILKYFIGNGDPVQQELYWSGLRVVPILLFGYVSLGIYMNLSVWYKLSDQTRYGLYISGIGAILTIIFNIIFIPKYGFMASAWVSLAAYASMMLLSYFWGRKHYPIPYHLKRDLLYIFGSVIAVFISFVIFKRNLIVGNLIFIAFVGAAAYAERHNLKKFLGRS